MSDPENIQQQAHAGDPQAQCLLAMECLRSGLVGKASRWLEKARAQNFGPAHQLQGRLHAQGHRTAASPAQARVCFEQAIAAGCPSAHFDLALLSAEAATQTGDWQEVIHHLFAAAGSGMAIGWRMLALMATPAQQSDLLQAALAAGDTLSARLLAAIALADRDSHAARHWLAASAGAIIKSNALRQQQLDSETSSGAFTPSQQIISEQDYQLADFSRLGIFSYSAKVRAIDHAVSPAVCEYLISLAENDLRESMILDPQTGVRRRDKMRTNEAATLGPEVHNPAVLYWRSQLTRLAGAPEYHGEWISILHYRVGDEYQHHYDFLMPKHPDFEPAGHRCDTILIYLNEDFVGGATEFPKLALSVEPKLGKVLHFCSMSVDGTVDTDSLHAGLPVTQGEKWLASLWIRQRPFRKR